MLPNSKKYVPICSNTLYLWELYVLPTYHREKLDFGNLGFFCATWGLERVGKCGQTIATSPPREFPQMAVIVRESSPTSPEFRFALVSKIFDFHSYLGKWPNLTSIFFRWVPTRFVSCHFQVPFVIDVFVPKVFTLIFWLFTLDNPKLISWTWYIPTNEPGPLQNGSAKVCCAEKSNKLNQLKLLNWLQFGSTPQPVTVAT